MQFQIIFETRIHHLAGLAILVFRRKRSACDIFNLFVQASQIAICENIFQYVTVFKHYRKPIIPGSFNIPIGIRRRIRDVISYHWPAVYTVTANQMIDLFDR